MIILASMTFASAMVYWLHRYVSAWFSPNLTSFIDLILFITILVATHSFLKNLRDGR